MSHTFSATDSCTEEACEAMPQCKLCYRTKSPQGRSVPAAMVGDYCSHDCPGYADEPYPGHLWPGELRARREETDGGQR